MKLDDLKNQKLKVLRDLIAFVWLRPDRSKDGFIIPDTYYNFGLRPGRFYLGEVIATGPKVTEVKTKDKIIFQEYGVIGGLDSIKENVICFLRERDCLAVIEEIQIPPPDLRKPLGRKEIEELEKQASLS